MKLFLAPEAAEKPILFEVFTRPEEESAALERMNHILASPPGAADRVKQAAKGILGEKGVSVLKALAKR